MSVILLTKGPVCTFTAIQTNGPVAVRRIGKNMYFRAANALVAANLGHLVKIYGSGNRANDVFVKKVPSEIEEPLQSNTDLCSLDEYTTKFYMPSPACIRPRLRDELVSRQFVKEEHFTNVHRGWSPVT